MNSTLRIGTRGSPLALRFTDALLLEPVVDGPTYLLALQNAVALLHGLEPLRLVIVDRPDAVQTVIRFVMPGPKATDTDRARYRVLNTILGGSFTSRMEDRFRRRFDE